MGHSFLVSLVIDCDFSDAIHTDQVSQTIDYGKVYDIVKRQMSIRSKLMEHLAGRILYALFDEFTNIQSVKITIIKENPPINSDSDGCGVIIETSRNEFMSFYHS